MQVSMNGLRKSLFQDVMKLREIIADSDCLEHNLIELHKQFDQVATAINILNAVFDPQDKEHFSDKSHLKIPYFNNEQE